MSHLMHEVISRHDTTQFEVYLYSLVPSALEDEMSARFGELAHKFVHLALWTEQQAAKIIAEDDLDILVDLAGHSVGSRPLILAYKPARVQITHPGHHGAIGLEAVDYKLTDPYADKPDNQDYLIEKLLPLEGCMFPFSRVAVAAEHPYCRENFGIAADAVVFGEFVALQIEPALPECMAWHSGTRTQWGAGVLAYESG